MTQFGNALYLFFKLPIGFNQIAPLCYVVYD